MEVLPTRSPSPSSPHLLNLSSNNYSACSSPYITGPSTPRCSDAATSPIFFRHFKSSTHSFSSKDDIEGDGSDFEFDFSGQLDITNVLSAADELFHGGKIKPLGEKYPNPGLETQTPDGKNRAVERHCYRGRPDRKSSISHIRRGFSRSLSPLRSTNQVETSRITYNDDDRKPPSSESQSSSANSTFSVSSLMSATAAKGRINKWRLKDLFLFRSTSEGHAQIKYLVSRRRKEEDDDMKAASFRSTESSVGSSRRRIVTAGGSVSAHELHYKTNRAAAEEMRRRTFLPYKQDLLGCLGFTSIAAVQEISRGIGSLTRG